MRTQRRDFLYIRIAPLSLQSFRLERPVNEITPRSRIKGYRKPLKSEERMYSVTDLGCEQIKGKSTVIILVL